MCLTSTLVCCAIDLVCSRLKGSDQMRRGKTNGLLWESSVVNCVSFSYRVKLSVDGTTVNNSFRIHSSTFLTDCTFDGARRALYRTCLVT